MRPVATHVHVATRYSRVASRIALLAGVLLGSAAIYAQEMHSRLGMPEVLSLLGSPLWVRIPIEATDPAEEIMPSRFTMGTRPSNSGIPFLESAEISFARVDKKYYMVIRSRQPVHEPAIGIVVREQVLHGVRSREYSLLLDPPQLAFGRSDERAIDPGLILDAALAQPVRSITVPPAVILQPVAGEAATPDDSRLGKARPPRAKRPRASDMTGADASARISRHAADEFPAASAPPATKSTPSIRNRANRITSPNRAAAVSPKARPDGPKLRLSLDAESVNTLPVASEEMRADLRRRQLILDTDDLTSALLERHHRITLLEKELASLAARVSAAERALNVKGTAPPSERSPSIAVVPAPDATPAPVAAVDPPVVESAKPGKKIEAPAKPAESPPMLWKILLIGAAALLAAAAVIWFIRRHLRARAEMFRILPQQADDYVAEVLAEPRQTRASRATTADCAEKTIKMKAPAFATRDAHKVAANVPAKVDPEVGVGTTHAAPEIHFELPPTPTSAIAIATDKPGLDLDFASTPASEEKNIPAGDIRARRMRYLQSRYQDIAILKPPLDAPQRLLSQAGRVHDEGAAEFAKRLLKYAAYSRPHTEEFWLGLLELLYREKFANDYLVNAKWFRKYHPQSMHWDEVQRIGYLLDPVEPLFASAAAWSHEAPAVGVWLPADPAEEKPLLSRTHMKLELAN